VLLRVDHYVAKLCVQAIDRHIRALSMISRR
jgi:hypothetical protein